MNKLIILQGIPASGKSTIAKEWQAEEPTKRVIICKDSFRLGRGQYWVPEQEDYIKKLEEAAILLAGFHKLDIIIDGTNLNMKLINRIMSILYNRDVKVELWLVHADKDTCIERDLNKDRTHSVGKDVIEMFYQKYLNWCSDYNIEVKSEGVYKYTLGTLTLYGVK
jgi:tRNA uridine 5-carbamoylmethylation protein Kti12